jgi:hypothetical protein
MAFDANDLTPHEQFAASRTEAGEVADFTPMTGPDGAKPIVRAGFLRKLMLQIDPSWCVRAAGVRLRGVRIEGALDLSDCSGAGGVGLPALMLDACEIPDPIDLSRSRLARLCLHASALCSLNAEAVRLDQALDASEIRPIEQACVINLRAARIAGDVILSAAKLARPLDPETPMAAGGRAALIVDSAQLDGGLWLDRGFEALGCVSLAGARLKGSLNCDGGAFLNRDDNGEGVALAAGHVRIDGAWSMRAGARVEGEAQFDGARFGFIEIANASLRNDGGVALCLRNAESAGECKINARLIGALILSSAEFGRTLDLRGIELAHPLNRRGDQFGCALDAVGARVHGALLLQAASIKGECAFAAAHIDGDLSFGGGRFLNTGGWALRAPHVDVGGNLTLTLADGDPTPFGQKTVIEGAATFDHAEIKGNVAWTGLELRGAAPTRARGAVLCFADARIVGALEARTLTAVQDSLIDLSGATCDALADDLKSGWGADTALVNLDGFRYRRLEHADKGDRWRSRLAWLRRAPAHAFSPQPYAVLASVYMRAGWREDARRILLEQRDTLTRHSTSGPLTRILSSAFGMIAGYGFAPIRAARALALYLAIGLIGVFIMDMQGALVRPNGHSCSGAIEPALYAVDVALPVIDLQQQDACAPGRAARAELSAGIAMPDTEWRLFEGVALWRWAHALYALFGAILTALAIVTFTGMLKPKQLD